MVSTPTLSLFASIKVEFGDKPSVHGGETHKIKHFLSSLIMWLVVRGYHTLKAVELCIIAALSPVAAASLNVKGLTQESDLRSWLLHPQIILIF